VRIASDSKIFDSLISDGCVIEAHSTIEKSILSPGVRVMSGAVIRESVILTDAIIEANSVIERTVVDKHVRIGRDSHIGGLHPDKRPLITMIGKNSHLPNKLTIEPGAVIATDVIPSDITTDLIEGDAYIQTTRMPYEI
jgi:ADP-glucose pyrophosphorylase